MQQIVNIVFINILIIVQIQPFFSISARCEGFSEGIDIGYGMCLPLPYETFDMSILCICATNLYNENLDTCRLSVHNEIQSNTAPSSLPPLLPQLKTSVSCVNSLKTSVSCVNSKIFSRDSMMTSYHCINPE
ncbi:hypothetical protein I4U23_015012 [Adineta vaga]|nr:hypothetical protein I4U23_015012 [Adineta vaga]